MDVLRDARWVAERARRVRVAGADAVDAAAGQIVEGMARERYSAAKWREHAMHPKERTARTVDWIFVVDLLNFSFWLDGERDASVAVEYRGQVHTGYFALCACVNRAIEDGLNVADPASVLAASREQLRHVFRTRDGDAPFPMVEARVDSLQQAARTLVDSFSGSFVGVVERAGGRAAALLGLLLEYFPTFRDAAVYDGREVHLLKRAQILVGDLWACFEGTSYGAFSDIDAITMFADYRVPQALLLLGALQYDGALEARLRTRELMASGDPDEVEIRACSIWAVELLRRAITRRRPDAPVNAVIIDFYLWDFTKQHPEAIRALPYHRTRSVYY